MYDGDRLSKIDRDNYLIRLSKEFAFTGISIPECIILGGERVRLRSLAMGVSKKRGCLTEGELAEADRVAALARKKRAGIVKTIGSADLTKAEAEDLFRTAAGLGRALDTLDRAREPKPSVAEASRQARLQDGRRWLGLVKRIYGRETKRDEFQ